MLCTRKAIRANNVKYHIDKSVDSPSCRMCGETGDTISHIVSKCSKLAQREYKRRYDNFTRMVHWKLYEKFNLEKPEKWCLHNPRNVSENVNHKLIYDMNVQCDNIIVERRPDIVIANKMEKTAIITDVEIPGKKRITHLKKEKIEKYPNLKREIQRFWNLKKIDAMPVVLGVSGVLQRALRNM